MVSTKKQELVRKLIHHINESPIIGILNLENLPAAQFQLMRKTLLQSGVNISVARKRLLIRALTEAKKDNVAQLQEKIKGMPALLFSKDNPFKLYSQIQKSKSEASAKPGQKAPHDIIVRAGPTSFAPGPIISELAAVGIKTKVEAGKLAVISDTMVAKEGDVISQKLSETLKRLDIKPMEIGLDLVAVWEGGIVFTSKELYIDEAEYLANITAAAQEAFNLAIEAAYPCSETTELLLQKAFRESKTLGIEQDILTDETRDEILAKSERQALSVKKEANL